MKKISVLFLTFVMLIVGMLSAASAEDDNPINIDADIIGDNFLDSEMTLTYKIYGGSGTYTSGIYTFYYLDNHDATTEFMSGNLDLVNKSGEIAFTVPSGNGTDGVKTLLTVCDSEGRTKNWTCYMALFDTKVLIKTKFSKDSYKVGDEITADWEITKDTGNYTRIDYTCFVKYEHGSRNVLYGKLDPAKKRGTIKFTPESGLEAAIMYTVYDSKTQRAEYLFSKYIPLTGWKDPNEDDFMVYLTLNDDIYELGKEVNAYYEVVGKEGTYTSAEYEWYVLDHNYQQSKAASGTLDLGKEKGWITFIPKTGMKAFARIILHAPDGHTKSIEGGDVLLVGEPDPTPTPTPTSTASAPTPTPAAPTPTSEPEDKVEAFVTRCYSIILGRKPDAAGFADWTTALRNKTKTASEIIYGFVGSNEFKNKNYSCSDTVEILYKAMLGRGSDAKGKEYWVTKLEDGQPVAAAINGFCASNEFQRICREYGITPGSVKVDNANEAGNGNNGADNPRILTSARRTIKKEKAESFVRRCYARILGREVDQDGLNNWTEILTSGQMTPEQVANSFFSSEEFTNRNLDSDAQVKILYKVYLNRDADQEGLAAWTEKLNNGTTLQELLKAFSKTSEFKAIISSMIE